MLTSHSGRLHRICNPETKVHVGSNPTVSSNFFVESSTWLGRLVLSQKKAVQSLPRQPNGDCSSIGRVLDCGSRGSGIVARLSPILRPEGRLSFSLKRIPFCKVVAQIRFSVAGFIFLKKVNQKTFFLNLSRSNVYLSPVKTSVRLRYAPLNVVKTRKLGVNRNPSNCIGAFLVFDWQRLGKREVVSKFKRKRCRNVSFS